jgi:hypothetical protein
MLTGVALPLSEILLDLIVPHNIGPRVHARDGKLEVQFLFRHGDRVLPFIQDGQFRIARWGNRRGPNGSSSRIPFSPPRCQNVGEHVSPRFGQVTVP